MLLFSFRVNLCKNLSKNKFGVCNTATLIFELSNTQRRDNSYGGGRLYKPKRITQDGVHTDKGIIGIEVSAFSVD